MRACACDRCKRSGGSSSDATTSRFYYLCLCVLAVVIVGALNLMRSPTGRAFIAIRDSETAAKSMGIDIAAYKVKSFAICAAITGLAGSLYAHKLSFISPEMFTLLLSIEFVMVIIIGGAIGLHGAMLGAIFIVMVDPLLTWVKDDVPSFLAGIATGLGVGAGRAQVHGADPRQRCLGGRSQGCDLRRHHHALHPVRAHGALWPLAEDQALLPALPALQEGDLSSARRPT